MRHIKEIAVAPLGAVLCVCACLVGCERREAAPSSPAPAPKVQSAGTSTTATIEERAHDPVYQKQLKDVEKKLQDIRKQREEIKSLMGQLREHVRASLPKDATDAQVQAALDKNSAWQELVAALKKNGIKEERNRAVAQAAVRQRIMQKKTESAASTTPAEK